MSRAKLIQATVARPIGEGASACWWLMSGRERGFSRFGYPHPSLRDMADRWEISFGAIKADEFGPYIEVRPQGLPPTSPEKVAAVWRVRDAVPGTREAEVADAAVYALELADREAA